MSQFGHGDALWFVTWFSLVWLISTHTIAREPAPDHGSERIQLGDVGYLRRGHFHLLFSAGRPQGGRQIGVDVPPTFEPLNVGRIARGQPRPPGYLCTKTVRKLGDGLRPSICDDPCV